jgi:GAF domain-containing protein
MMGSDVVDEVTRTESDLTAELTSNLSQTMRELYSAGSVSDTLMQVVELAVTTVAGCDCAGIFVPDGTQVKAPVSSDPLVTELDRLQHEMGEGPCLDATSLGSPFYAEDLSDDERWPNFGSKATLLGIRSLHALPLRFNGTPGALNLYARYPNAFGVIDRGKAVLLAAMADLALSSAESHEDEERRNTTLHAALTTREIIGQAQGILMERERINSDRAFDVLRRASQHLNVKLRDIAQDLVDTGERPDTGQPSLPDRNRS